MPTLFPGRQLALHWSHPSSEGNATPEQGESRGVGSGEQRGPNSATRCESQAPEAVSITPETADWGPLGCGGCMALPGPLQSIGEEIQGKDIAAEDWLEASSALGFAVGIESSK